tara:strand:+ start:9386 stop:9640 length:255 start_codon:yes stop_codon:yes gene_type:complete
MSVFYDNSTDDIDSMKTLAYKKNRVIFIDEPPTVRDDTPSDNERIGDNFTMEIHGTTDDQKEDVCISRKCEQLLPDKRQKTSGD